MQLRKRKVRPNSTETYVPTCDTYMNVPLYVRLDLVHGCVLAWRLFCTYLYTYMSVCARMYVGALMICCKCIRICEHMHVRILL